MGGVKGCVYFMAALMLRILELKLGLQPCIVTKAIKYTFICPTDILIFILININFIRVGFRGI